MSGFVAYHRPPSSCMGLAQADVAATVAGAGGGDPGRRQHAHPGGGRRGAQRHLPRAARRLRQGRRRGDLRRLKQPPLTDCCTVCHGSPALASMPPACPASHCHACAFVDIRSVTTCRQMSEVRVTDLMLRACHAGGCVAGRGRSGKDRRRRPLIWRFHDSKPARTLRRALRLRHRPQRRLQ